jgi:ABC-2 type transport system permease protein
VLIVVALLLGILANLPLGFAIGALVPTDPAGHDLGHAPDHRARLDLRDLRRHERLWDWVQVLAQAFPMYWLGHLMRYAFLPEAAVVGELYGAWRIGPASRC